MSDAPVAAAAAWREPSIPSLSPMNWYTSSDNRAGSAARNSGWFLLTYSNTPTTPSVARSLAPRAPLYSRAPRSASSSTNALSSVMSLGRSTIVFAAATTSGNVSRIRRASRFGAASAGTSGSNSAFNVWIGRQRPKIASDIAEDPRTKSSTINPIHRPKTPRSVFSCASSIRSMAFPSGSSNRNVRKRSSPASTSDTSACGVRPPARALTTAGVSSLARSVRAALRASWMSVSRLPLGRDTYLRITASTESGSRTGTATGVTGVTGACCS